MRLQRPLALIAAALAIIAVAAVLILWLGARTPWARNAVAGAISEATGLPVAIEAMRLGLGSRPALEIDGLVVPQPAGFGTEPFLAIARVRAVLPWRALRGEPDLESLVAMDATLRLVVSESGESNWSRLFGQTAEAGVAPGEPAPDWSVARFALDRGAVEYADDAARSRWRLTAIGAKATDVAPGVSFPAELRGGGVVGENTFHYSFEGEARIEPDRGRYEASRIGFTSWAGGEPLPLAGVELEGTLRRAAWELASGVAVREAGRFELAGIPGQFSGRFDLDEESLEANIAVTTGVFDLRRPAIAFGHPLPKTTDPMVFQSMELSASARTSEGVLALDPVRGRLDDTRFEGRIVPAARLIRAELDRIDLNRYLPPAAGDAPEAPRRPSTREAKATLEEQVAELQKLDVDAEIRVGEATIGRARVRDAVIRVERAVAAP